MFVFCFAEKKEMAVPIFTLIRACELKEHNYFTRNLLFSFGNLLFSFGNLLFSFGNSLRIFLSKVR